MKLVRMFRWMLGRCDECNAPRGTHSEACPLVMSHARVPQVTRHERDRLTPR